MRSALATTGLLLGSCVLAVLVGEAFVRVLAPQQVIRPLTGLYERDEVFGWRHRPRVDLVVNTGERPARVVTDEHGFRVVAPGRPDRPGTPDRRVLVIGDSFVEGLMVDGRETAAKVLERRLDERLGGSHEVVNAGTAGWGPIQYLELARQELARRDYDLGIVVLYTGNDFKPDDTVRKADFGARHRFRLPRVLDWKEFVYTLLFPINDWLEERSHLFVLLKNRLEVLRAKLGLTNFYFPPVYRTDLDLEDHWEFGFEACEAIAAEFHRRGIPVAFALMPADYQVREEILIRYAEGYGWTRDRLDMELPSKAMASRFARRPDLPFVDLLPPLRDADTGEPLFGSVDKHLTARGHRVVAERLLPVAVSLLGAAAGAPAAAVPEGTAR